MGVGVDTDRYIFFSEDMQETSVGIEIAKRPVPSVCVKFEGDIVFFHCPGQLSVERFRIEGRFIAIDPYKVAMAYNIVKS